MQPGDTADKIDLITLSSQLASVTLDECEEYGIDYDSFQTIDSEYDDFLHDIAKNQSLQHISQTYLVVLKDMESVKPAAKDIVGYFTISAGSVRFNRDLRKQFSISEEELGTIVIQRLAAKKDSEYCHFIKLVTNTVRKMYVDYFYPHINIPFISLEADIRVDEENRQRYEKAGYVCISDENDRYSGQENPVMICSLLDKSQ